MADPASDAPEASDSETADDTDGTDADGTDADGSPATSAEASDEELRRRVEEKYDFDDFGPADMAEMTREEWEVAFDPDTWITGTELLDRVEKDLRSRVANRDVFARVERVDDDGEDRLLAYSDEGYVVVFADGTVEGRGTILRDVEPTVALCSMDDYEPPEPPAGAGLPSPESVTAGTGELGNTMLQIVAGAQLLVGIGLLLAWVFTDLSTVVAPAAAIAFVLAAVFLFVVVANARLSDKYRAEEYRDRLREVGTGEGEPPEFVPGVGEDANGAGDDPSTAADVAEGADRAGGSNASD